ncbi:MAG: nucleotide exchange factor GrpE [Clostridia bacterium]|nr:nucleotide exchange factor GrpE [Clostridia bacterium]MBR6553318.1 nucleotide exchange factor GrpE [Clostridia bacterium]
MKKGRLPMEENKKDTAPETEAPETEATPAGETPETEKKEKKDKKFFHKEQKELEAAKAQLAEKENQYLRLYAEYENFRKRSEKEKTDCYNTAYGDALTAFLPLIDSMTQALQFSPEDQGIKALAKQLSDILAKLNITEIESDGAQFDPNVHNAIMHEENPELGENVVTQTFQKGYKRGDKVLRCAMVKVAN